MPETSSADIYACDAMRSVTGDTVRPGGFRVTKRGVDYCGLKAGTRLLDVGCGTGSSVDYLIKEYQIDAAGIDPSDKMLELGKSRNPKLPIAFGTAEEIPYADRSMGALLIECCLHLADLDEALPEFYRVLSPDGWLIINDIYLRPRPCDDKELLANSENNFMDKDTVIKHLENYGFQTVLWEDHTHELKQLIIDIIMQYDSMSNFWEAINCNCNNCFLTEHSNARLGYYLLVAQRCS